MNLSARVVEEGFIDLVSAARLVENLHLHLPDITVSPPDNDCDNEEEKDLAPEVAESLRKDAALDAALSASEDSDEEGEEFSTSGFLTDYTSTIELDELPALKDMTPEMRRLALAKER